MKQGGTASARIPTRDAADAVVRPRLVLADDHPEILDELHTLLVAEFEMAGCVTNGNELVRAVIELDPDVIITDVYMPGIDGIEASRRILQQAPEALVVMLSMHNEPALIAKALAIGVRGYVLKLDAGEELGPAIRAVLKVRPTSRERS